MKSRYSILQLMFCVLIITSGSSNNAAGKTLPAWKFAVISDTQGNNRDENNKSCIFHNEEYHGYILVTIDGVKATVQWRAMVDISDSGWKVLDSFRYTAGNVKVH